MDLHLPRRWGGENQGKAAACRQQSTPSPHRHRVQSAPAGASTPALLLQHKPRVIILKILWLHGAIFKLTSMKKQNLSQVSLRCFIKREFWMFELETHLNGFLLRKPS